MFSDFAEFSGATFGGGTWFSRATFAGQAWLYGMTFARDLQARDTWFNDPAAQETFCRIARRNCEDRGDRDEADYYHEAIERALRIVSTTPAHAISETSCDDLLVFLFFFSLVYIGDRQSSYLTDVLTEGVTG
ncbi:MAG TPA: pentapeptide repeat-containing protein [Candidatus Bathyarchaeia archaeon]|nr:pentapeptide repeat-containing protein [Candidatus Bathyarchaeia archaeon]